MSGWRPRPARAASRADLLLEVKYAALCAAAVAKVRAVLAAYVELPRVVRLVLVRTGADGAEFDDEVRRRALAGGFGSARCRRRRGPALGRQPTLTTRLLRCRYCSNSTSSTRKCEETKVWHSRRTVRGAVAARRSRVPPPHAARAAREGTTRLKDRSIRRATSPQGRGGRRVGGAGQLRRSPPASWSRRGR